MSTTTHEMKPLSESIRLERRGDAGVLWLDVPGKPVNVLTEAFEGELEQALDVVDADGAIKVLVIASGKDAGFIAGADVGMLQAVDGAGAASRLSRGAQSVMDRIEAFRAPVVAAIHGRCLGGGLELAMACRGRVASDEQATRLGQPEVKLGLIPGAGGTQRLPRLVGLEDALTMILTGRELTRRQALDKGLIDMVVHPAILVDVAIDHAHRLVDGLTVDRGRHEALAERLREALTEGNPLGRWMVYRQARERTRRETHGNIPAAAKVIDVIQRGLEDGVEAGLKLEAKVFGELATSREARHMMTLFQAQQALKRESGVPGDVSARDVRKVGVVGAGLMGSGIAYVSTAEAGVRVRIQDLERDLVRDGIRDVREILEDRVGKGLTEPGERDRAISRLGGTTSYDGFVGADVVIEAVAEDLEIKQQILRDIEAIGGEDTIFASNTSAIPIGSIAEAAQRPENVLGMHYFSPVHKVPLLEVVRAAKTAPEAVATAVALGKRQGRTVIVVHDGPGFYTSRVLGRLMAEAGRLLSEGVAIDAVDEAMENAGFPVGPFQLMDEVGLDVAAGVAETLARAFPARFGMPAVLERLTDDGREGRKNGRGFYVYEDGERVDHAVDESVYDVMDIGKPERMDAERIAQRCLTAFANEAAWCYGDGVVRSARDADVGAVFGLGFPVHRGGPMAMIDDEGCEAFVERLSKLKLEHGGRFEPAPVLLEAVRRGSAMHDGDAPASGWHLDDGGAEGRS